MKTIRSLIVGSLMFFSSLWLSSLCAQTPMELQECIEYAIQNSLQVQKSQLGIRSQHVLKNQARMNRLPSLDAGISNSQSWGQYTTNNSSFDISSNVNLFNGFRLANAEKKSAIDMIAAEIQDEVVSDNVALDVVAAFLNVLYNTELEHVAQLQVNTVESELAIANTRLRAGALAKEGLLEIRSELARMKATLVEAQSSKFSALVSLQQLMNYNDGDIEIIAPVLPEVSATISLQAAKDVYAQALPQRPEVKWADLQLESSELALKMAKAGYYPSLSMFAGYGNYYNNSNSLSLTDQFKLNESKRVGVSLSIPIFNRHEATNTVKLAEITIEEKTIEVEQEKKKLRETIQNAWTKAVNARERYLSKKEVLISSKEVFRFAEEKYTLGALPALELNIQRNRLLVAEVDLLQSKHEFIFATKVLEFYAGLPLVL